MLRLIVLLVFISLVSCSKEPLNPFVKNVEPINIHLECTEVASAFSTFNLAITNQEEYDTFFQEYFTKPLESWLESNYEFLLEGVIKNYPDAQESEYDSILVNHYVYNFYPYRYIIRCEHPSVDFEKYTLLGQGTSLSGCSEPETKVDISINEDSKEVTYHLEVRPLGACAAEFSVQEWILIEKCPPEYSFIYELVKTM